MRGSGDVPIGKVLVMQVLKYEFEFNPQHPPRRKLGYDYLHVLVIPVLENQRQTDHCDSPASQTSRLDK